MPRPSPQQVRHLEGLRAEVLAEMLAIGMLSAEHRQTLQAVPLGVLRSNATQRHGVTRWSGDGQGGLKVDVVDLNPHLLTEHWRDYAAFVLFHEYLHVLGHRAHDRTFRALESRWPNTTASSRGKAFTHARRLARASWHWVCPTCEERYPRQRKGQGRYMCRRCKSVLKDEPSRDIE
ncbi:MAG: hypothetical protein ACO2Y2_01355 [Poseidonia sp.]